jgi:Ni/Fe-hydrogenase 1 B-type cytochrome subunit
MSEPTNLHRVYVWERPVRLYHWLNALVVTVLCATGFLIGQPVLPAAVGEASFNYSFGWVRFIHFAAAYVFFFNFVFRIYWGFVGNQFAHWRNFLPLDRNTLQRQWREAIEIWKVDILQARNEPVESIGHNALAGWTYFLTFLAFLFQCATGFGLYAAMSHGLLANSFAWVVPLMGGDFAVRQWHHMAMWFFIIFSMIHVYLVFYHDYVEGRGVISSMAGGWKFVERKPR